MPEHAQQTTLATKNIYDQTMNDNSATFKNQ